MTQSRFHFNDGLSCDCCSPFCLPSWDPQHRSHFLHLFLTPWSWPACLEVFIKKEKMERRAKRQIFNFTVKIALEMSADIRPGGTMRLSNPLTTSLMRSLLTDRKHVRCHLSRLIEMDPSLSVSSHQVTFPSQKSSGVWKQTWRYYAGLKGKHLALYFVV